MAAKKKAKKKAAKKQPAKKKTASKKSARKPAAKKNAIVPTPDPSKGARTSTTTPRTANATSFAPGNDLWKARSSHGRRPIFENEDQLWDACVEYFDWVQSHPLTETKTFSYEGDAFDHDVNRMHAMTIIELCAFLDISRSTWDRYRKNADFSIITERVEAIIYAQKFTGAAVGLLNSNLIARELGLRDGTDVTARVSVTDKKADELNDDELAAIACGGSAGVTSPTGSA